MSKFFKCLSIGFVLVGGFWAGVGSVFLATISIGLAGASALMIKPKKIREVMK